jgi:hypothetical protein
MPVKLKVLYGEDGRIVSLSRLGEQTDAHDATIPVLRSGVEPGEGQRAAIVELDPAWHGRRLSDIHERFTVVHDVQGARLKAHAEPQAVK